MEIQLRFLVPLRAFFAVSDTFAFQLVFVSLSFALASQAFAVDGKAIFAGTCIACHGAKGEGNPKIGAPNIAGMDAVYITRQLTNFSTGMRGAAPNDTYGAQMRGAVQVLKSDADRQSIAAFVAAMPKVRSATDIKANLANGSTQFNAVCSSCHESRAQGNVQMGAPSLIGLEPVYMERQVLAFRDGGRGYHKDDRAGALMKVGATMLPDTKSVHDVVAYINTLK